MIIIIERCDSKFRLEEVAAVTKGQKLIRSLFILMLLLLLFGHYSTASLTPLTAHKRSERSINYGPSTIIKSQRIKGGMLYLCKYDKWYSLDTVKRRFLWLWYPEDMNLGKENNINNPIEYSWGEISISSNYKLGKFYGIVNDPNINTVRLELNVNGKMEIFEQKELNNNMFLFTWDGGITSYDGKIMGLDKNSNIIYEKQLP